MKGFPVALMTLALSITFLTGCISGDDVSPQADDSVPEEPDQVEVTATTGSLRGTVSSDLFEPLGGALVSVVEAEVETKVARGGSFVVNDLDPGRYTVHIQALGYEPATRAAQIEAGEVTELAIQMVPLPSNDPYIATREFQGIVSLAVAWQLEGPTGCMIIPSPVLLDVKNCGGIRFGGENGEIPINVTDDVKTILVEMVWDPAGPLGETLSLDLLCPEVPRGNGGAVLDTNHVCYFPTPGATSPLIHRVDEQHWIEGGYNFTGDWAARVFATHGMLGSYDLTKIDIGVAYEQRFTIHTNVFHKEPAPEGFSGIPDA